MNKDIFVDSSKDDQRVKHLRRFSKFDTYVIHLVRDVRGFVVSQLSRRKEKTAAEIARLWVKVNRKIENLLETFPNNQFIRVRYEDLCSDVQGTLDRLYRFCRVDPVTVKDFRSVPQHIVGNSMRLRNSSEIALDERWKTELSKEQLRTIDQIAGTLYHRYGYE